MTLAEFWRLVGSSARQAVLAQVRRAGSACAADVARAVLADRVGVARILRDMRRGGLLLVNPVRGKHGLPRLDYSLHPLLGQWLQHTEEVLTRLKPESESEAGNAPPEEEEGVPQADRPQDH